jgi:hypothetical protein
VGNNKRRLVSATVLLIIAFLVHVKNKKADYEPARDRKDALPADLKKKKVLVRSPRAARATSTPSSGRGSRNSSASLSPAGTAPRSATCSSSPSSLLSAPSSASTSPPSTAASSRPSSRRTFLFSSDAYPLPHADHRSRSGGRSCLFRELLPGLPEP